MSHHKINYKCLSFPSRFHPQKQTQTQDNTSATTSPQTLTGGTATPLSSNHPQQHLHDLLSSPTGNASAAAAAAAAADSTAAAAATAVPSSALAGSPAAVPLPFTVAAPILPLGIATLRDDSTESDQSLTGSQSQSEALHRFVWVLTACKLWQHFDLIVIGKCERCQDLKLVRS